MNYPKINQELCTGFGACIDACPMEAIVLEDGKARIIEENCSNCLMCIGVCPIEAIG